MRSSRVLALVVAVVSVVGLAVVYGLDAVAASEQAPDSGAWWLYPFVGAAILAPVLVGLLVEWRRPRHPVAWILLLGGLSVELSLGTSV